MSENYTWIGLKIPLDAVSLQSMIRALRRQRPAIAPGDLRGWLWAAADDPRVAELDRLARLGASEEIDALANELYGLRRSG